MRTDVKPLFGRAEMYSRFSTYFLLVKRSTNVEELFVGAGGQNPVFVQNRGSFLTFRTETSKFLRSVEIIEAPDVVNFNKTKEHRNAIFNISTD